MSHRPRRLRTGSVAAVSLIAGLLLVTTPGASANEPLPEGSATLQDFVAGSVPQWNFARANRNDPCWPESAFDGNGNPADGGNVQNS